MKVLERGIKKIVLSAAAIFWRRKSGPKQVPDLKGINSILIYRPEKIGDLFMAFPLIKAFLKINPGIQIDLLISPSAYPLIDGDKRFRHIFIYKKSLLADIKTALTIRKNKYDIIIDLVGSDSVTAALTVLYISKGRSVAVAVGKRNLAKYYDFNFGILPDRHMIESTLQVLDLWQIENKGDYILSPPVLRESDIKLADDFMKNLNLSPGEKSIGINISAGNKKRIWSQNNYIGLIKLIQIKYPSCKIIIFVVPEEYFHAQQLATDSPGISIIPPGLTLLGAVAILSKIDYFISPDTSMIHIARSFAIPVVGLYLPAQENYKRWFPIGQKEGIIVAADDYSIDRITPEAVIKEMEKLAAVK
jgi:ADP-heptose:LPS heptosyltransferase